MKIGRLVTGTFLGLLIGITLASCKEQKAPEPISTEEMSEIANADQNSLSVLH